jgi:hypothetical protein
MYFVRVVVAVATVVAVVAAAVMLMRDRRPAFRRWVISGRRCVLPSGIVLAGTRVYDTHAMCLAQAFSRRTEYGECAQGNITPEAEGSTDLYDSKEACDHASEPS